jgi:hypothetical protein
MASNALQVTAKPENQRIAKRIAFQKWRFENFP